MLLQYPPSPYASTYIKHTMNKQAHVAIAVKCMHEAAALTRAFTPRKVYAGET